MPGNVSMQLKSRKILVTCADATQSSVELEMVCAEQHTVSLKLGIVLVTCDVTHVSLKLGIVLEACADAP